MPQNRTPRKRHAEPDGALGRPAGGPARTMAQPCLRVRETARFGRRVRGVARECTPWPTPARGCTADPVSSHDYTALHAQRGQPATPRPSPVTSPQPPAPTRPTSTRDLGPWAGLTGSCGYAGTRRRGRGRRYRRASCVHICHRGTRLWNTATVCRARRCTTVHATPHGTTRAHIHGMTTTTTKHGDGCVMSFGRLSADGSCERCDELRKGAPVRRWSTSRRAADERRRVEEIQAHSCSRSGCGPVCTAFDW
jgi:hypothetical protein